MALPGQAARTGHWPRAEPSRGRPAMWLGLQERRRQDRAAASHSPVPRDGTAGSFLDTTLPRGTSAPNELGRKGLQREKHEPVFAGWIPGLHLEGRVQKITVHWLTHANTVHRTRTNSLESTAGLETLWPSPARACSSEGGLQGRQRTAQHKDALAGDFLLRSAKPQETTGFTGTKNRRANPDEGELITKAIYSTLAVATHRQPRCPLDEKGSVSERGRKNLNTTHEQRNKWRSTTEITTGLLQMLETCQVSLWLPGCRTVSRGTSWKRRCQPGTAGPQQHGQAHAGQLGVRTIAVRAAGNHQCGNDRPRDRCPKATAFGQGSLRDTLLLTRHQHARAP